MPKIANNTRPIPDRLIGVIRHFAVRITFLFPKVYPKGARSYDASGQWNFYIRHLPRSNLHFAVVVWVPLTMVAFRRPTLSASTGSGFSRRIDRVVRMISNRSVVVEAVAVVACSVMASSPP